MKVGFSNTSNVMVSVCVITFNQEPYIDLALKSIVVQKTNFPYNIYIGEDCSKDGTRNICAEYEKYYKGKINLLPSINNIGVMPNFIRTLQACNGRYIAICEGDDYWTDPLKLQKQVDILENNPEYAMCFTNRTKIDSEGKIISEDTIPERFKRDLMPEDLIGSFTPPTQTVVFRRDLLDNNIFYSTHKIFNGDTFLFWYIAQFGKTAYLDEITAAYRVSGEGIYSSMNTINRLENRLNTVKVLESLINDQYRILLRRSKGVIYQRLFVLYFLSGKISNALRIYKKILRISLIVSMRAIKLLIIAKYLKVKITD